jgi:hypothetical protein
MVQGVWINDDGSMANLIFIIKVLNMTKPFDKTNLPPLQHSIIPDLRKV